MTDHAPADDDSKAVPDVSYRLQFNKGFTFTDAAHIVPYLSDLGISHCYSSPWLKARPGSSHGYDIVDHNAINPEVGDRSSFEDFVGGLQHRRMGLVADIVPNHMGVMGADNNWWLDVLENGPASAYADFFDIEWHPQKKELQNKLLIPVLGDHYGKVLENRELNLVFDEKQGAFSVFYYEHRFPVDPRTYPFILNAADEQLVRSLEHNQPVLLEFQSIVNSFAKLPARESADPEAIQERRRDKDIFKHHLSQLYASNGTLRDYITNRVDSINQMSQVALHGGLLHELLEQQAYRLAYWRVAGDEINYRRFFDINDLAGLRTEIPHVFDATHRLILSLVAQNKIQGLRIDHADGLYDPVRYYERLNEKTAARLDIPPKPDVPPVYIVAEKIVANYEYLSSQWPICGTTGYEFANIVNGVFINAEAEKAMTDTYTRFIGQRLNFDEITYQAKDHLIRTSLASELNVLANHLNKISEAHPKTRDYTLNSLRDALREVVACFPVYRTYTNGSTVRKEDRQYNDWAIAQAKRRSRAADKSVFDFLHNVLNIEQNGEVHTGELVRFVMKFQQYTAPVMAKGYEDTALYEYHRLVSLNEVGGDPKRFGNSVNAFHHFNQERARLWPGAMLSLSTHDTKRSADVRARVNVLSEIPRRWHESIFRWSRLNRRRKTKIDNSLAPTRNDEYLFYQALAGTWPLYPMDEAKLAGYRRRIESYMIKAVREAKQHTSWINNNEPYENAVRGFVQQCLDFKTNAWFVDEFTAFVQSIVRPGLLNALAQAALHLSSPGSPDIYQGEELWRFSLVDPDNRRAVNFHRRRQLLQRMNETLHAPQTDRLAYLRSLLDNLHDGRIKLFAIRQLLEFRRENGALFRNGDYLKLNVHGPLCEHVIAFARRYEKRQIIVVAPRLLNDLLSDGHVQPLGELWQDTWLELPGNNAGHFSDVFTQLDVPVRHEGENARLDLAQVFGHFPLALLHNPWR